MEYTKEKPLGGDFVVLSFLRRLFGLKDKQNKIPDESPVLSVEVPEPELEPLPPERKTFSDRYYGSSYFHSSDASLPEVLANRGNHGELLLCNELDKLDCYKRVLVNAYLQNVSGHFSEVDAICITRKGVFVLEYKNWGGTIYGKESDENWTACYGKQKHSQYSPLKQNLGHVAALLFNFPHIDPVRVFPLVVFSNRCTLRVETSSMPVVHRQNLLNALHCIVADLDDVFSVYEVERMHSFLMERCKQPEQVKFAHVAHVKEIQQKVKSHN